MSAASPAKPRRAWVAPGLKSDPIPVIENTVVWIAAAFGMIAALATLAIVVAFVAEVIARWAGAPFDPTNLVSGLLVVATFTGLAWTAIRAEHISVQFVSERFSPRFSHGLDIAIWGLGSIYLIWLVFEAFMTAAANTWPYPEMIPDGIGLAPRWPWRWAFAVATVPFVLVAILNFIRAILGRRPYDDVLKADEREGGHPGEEPDEQQIVVGGK